MSDTPEKKNRGILHRLSEFFANTAARAALRQFDKDTDSLQKSFLQLVHASGKPRGLRWARCDFLPDRVLLRDPDSGLLTLCLGLNVAFEALPGGDMEDVEAVGMVRDASAVFHFRDGRWGTAGRVLFNHSPALAAERMDDSWRQVPL